MMAVVAHQRTAAALRAIELVARKTIVDQQQGTTTESASPGSRPVGGGEANLTEITGRQGELVGQRLCTVEQTPLGWSVMPDELAVFPGHPAFENRAFLPMHQMDGQGIEQFVGQYQPVEVLRQAVEPDDAVEQMRGVAGDTLALAFTQFAGKFEDGVRRGQSAASFQFEQQVGGQTARTGADFDDLRCAQRHDLLDLRGQRPGKERTDFRGGDEIARRTELVRATRVVTLPWGVEGQVHEAGKTDPAAGMSDVGSNECFQAVAEGLGVGCGKGKFHGGKKKMSCHLTLLCGLSGATLKVSSTGESAMIVIQHQSGRVQINVYGEFTLADYREFEEMINYKAKFEGPVDLLVDLREMADFTLDVAWEELVFAREHPEAFRRIAVVTESQWISWSTWLTRLFVEAEMLVFAEETEALDWLNTV